MGAVVMNGDLISREALLAELSKRLSIVDMVGVAEIVESVPAVEAEPVVHAHWVRLTPDQKLSPFSDRTHSCSKCGKHGYKWYDRCWSCGAHMDEEVSDES